MTFKIVIIHKFSIYIRKNKEEEENGILKQYLKCVVKYYIKNFTDFAPYLSGCVFLV
jgi:hypothetical protein